MELKDIKHFKIEELCDILNVKAKLKKKKSIKSDSIFVCFVLFK